MMVAEHTGGLDEKEHLDFDHYTVADLAKVRSTPPYQDMERSWADAWSYLTRAVAALGETPLADEARRAIADTLPRRPDSVGFHTQSVHEPIRTPHFDIQLDSATGAIVRLTDRKQKRTWVEPAHPLGLFWHESFSEADYARLFDQYLKTRKSWALKDFGKPNAGRAGAVQARRLPQLVQCLSRSGPDEFTLLLRLNLPEVAPTEYGLPQEIWLRIDFPTAAKEVRYTLQWFDKKACRLPEAYWFSMGFAGCQPSGWQIEKIGQMISPLDVISKGGRSLHGFNRGVFYTDGREKLGVESLDCPIVAPGAPSLLDFNDRVPDLAGGWHFNLYNSKWGTNFPTWYDDDAQFRFVIRIE